MSAQCRQGYTVSTHCPGRRHVHAAHTAALPAHQLLHRCPRRHWLHLKAVCDGHGAEAPDPLTRWPDRVQQAPLTPSCAYTLPGASLSFRLSPPYSPIWAQLMLQVGLHPRPHPRRAPSSE